MEPITKAYGTAAWPSKLASSTFLTAICMKGIGQQTKCAAMVSFAHLQEIFIGASGGLANATVGEKKRIRQVSRIWATSCMT